MAVENDHTGDRVELSYNAALDLPDGDWTLALWLYIDSNSGAGSRAVLTWSTVSNSLDISLYGSSHATVANKISTLVWDAGNDLANPITDTTPGTSTGVWSHLAVRRSGNTFENYWNGTVNGTDTNAAVNGINPSATFKLGNYFDNSSALDGKIAEFAKWDRALNTAEITALANGIAPVYFRNSLKVYVPLIREYREYVVPITVTNQGTIIYRHPRMVYPFKAELGKGRLAFIPNVPLINPTKTILIELQDT